MAGLSRTEKYKELRMRLQDDTGSDSNTKALNPYESRLNRIDANNFAAPGNVLEDDHTAMHAREIKNTPVQDPLRRTQHNRVEPSFNDGFADNENYSSTFDNDYLDQYIREVKQYNMEQGSAFSDNTQVNVLRSMENNQKRPMNDPYENFGNSPLNMPKPPVELQDRTNTTKIPFQKPVEARPMQSSSTPVMMPSDPQPRVQYVHQSAPVSNSRKAFTEDLFENDDDYNEPTSTQNLTKEDIMAEVQNLVNGTEPDDFASYQQPVHTASTPVSQPTAYDYEAERTARQQLLNETTQMRAQLDDYEDNLNEVSDKMRHTNKILNIVLVVLILALAVILGIVIYWIVLARG